MHLIPYILIITTVLNITNCNRIRSGYSQLIPSRRTSAIPLSYSPPYSSSLGRTPVHAFTSSSQSSPDPIYYTTNGQTPQDEPIAFKFELPKSFTGPLEPNNILAQTTRMFENVILGPTSLAIYKDFIFAGTSGGGVFRGNLRTGNATRIAKIPNDACETRKWDTSACGRPLGVRVDSSGTLYFVDAYLGLHVVQFIGNEVKLTRLLSVEETGAKYMGHLVIDENAGTDGGHVLYITCASTKRDLTQWPAMVIEPDRSGIVVKYDVSTGQYEIIMRNLWYPTSIELNDAHTAVLIAEFSSRKVLKHYIKGPLNGNTEVWAENLPGESDHLIRSGDKTRETYWMPIVNARNASNPNLLDFMSDKPALRLEILERYTKMGNALESLGQQYKNEHLERVGFDMKTGIQFYQQNIANNYGLLLEMDSDGKIIGSIHSVDGTNSFISEVVEGHSDNPSERVLYIGSFGYPYIGKLIIKKPIYDLPIFTYSVNERPSDQNPQFKSLDINKAAVYDDLKFVDVPALLKSWKFQSEPNNRDKYEIK